MACAEPGATADRGGEHEGIAGNHEPKSEASVGRMDVLEGREAEVADDLQSDRITLDASEVGRSLGWMACVRHQSGDFNLGSARPSRRAYALHS